MRHRGARRIAMCALVGAAVLGVLMGSTRRSRAGAPRQGDRFVNLAGTRSLPSGIEMFPFFLRKAWTSIVPRYGGAELVAYDTAALQHNPSLTWIGHATFLVRMDGVAFVTDPMFSVALRLWTAITTRIASSPANSPCTVGST